MNMTDLILVCSLVGVFLFGYYVVKKWEESLHR